METVLNSDADKERKVILKSIRIKFALQSVFAVTMVLCTLFFDIFVYRYDGVTISLKGWNVLQSLLYGGSIGYANFSEIIYITLPWYLVVLTVFMVVMPLISMAMQAIFSFGLKKDNRKVGGISGVVLCGLIFAVYLLLLLSKHVTATDKAGDAHTFYSLYEIKASVLVIALMSLLGGAIQYFCRLEMMQDIRRYAVFYLILIVPTALMLVFNVYPSLLQTILAFKDYRLADGMWASKWVGIENIKILFSDSTMLMVIWQTIYLSVLRLIFSIFPSVFFALVFYHITSNKYRSFIQTIVYIPHFFSWVVIYAIVSAFLQPKGIVNNVLINYFGMDAPIDFLSKKDFFYTNMILSSVWKEVGWGTILFTASLMGIDKTLYEAASIDGAGVFAKLWHITLPGIIPIFVYQVIMSIGNLLKGAGGEQILLFATKAVENNKALVIDTWLYWQGLNELKFGLSAAVSFVQAIIGFGMVIGAHKISQKLIGIGAW